MSEPKSPWSLHVHCVVHPLVFSPQPHLLMEIKSSPFWKGMETLGPIKTETSLEMQEWCRWKC